MRAKDAAAPAPPGLPAPRPLEVITPNAPPSVPVGAPRDAAPAGTTWQPFAKPTPVKPGATTLLGLRAAREVAAPEVPTVSGVAYVTAVLAEIRRLRREQPTVRPLVVFDLDNTIFETRARTLAALSAYDEARGTDHFSGLALADVGKDGGHTARLRGLPEEVAADVQKFWLDWFWQGAHFMEDRVFVQVEKLVHEASRAGAEVVYLTGRVDRDATLAQLRAAGLPDADVDHVVCKPAVGANTGNFKGEWLRAKLDDPTCFLGWFMTEGRRDIATVQQHDARIPCVRLGYVHEREGHAVAADTPLIPEDWTRRLRRLPQVSDAP